MHKQLPEFERAQAKARKSGRRHFVVASIDQVGEGPKPEELELQWKSDVEKLRRVLRPFVARYGREQIIKAVARLFQRHVQSDIVLHCGSP
jgi:hypothetical protein